jgi:NAD(P)-dependent dehydrogenase (short-subunit alcohol dehydrogenase family)
MRLNGKIAVITGAASGIGRATALRFAREGAKVVVADINAEAGTSTVEVIRQQGGDAHFVQTDVGSPEQVRHMVEAAVETYGGLDILHNNAYWTEARTALETSLENWQRTLDVTLRPILLSAQAAVPHMQARGGGVIINTASIQSLVGIAGYAAYQAAKGGVLSLTRALSLELAPAIRVVAILPGAIDTPAVRISSDLSLDNFIASIPMQRLGLPEEIANTALFLASDEASYITGTGIVVDGGFIVP